MQDVEKRILSAGLDMDSSVRIIENGKYRYGMNLRVGINDTNNFQNVERVLGNTLIPNTLPAGDNITIGRYEDTVSNHLYFFNYNSNGQHGIYRLELSTQTITTVLVDPLLNFNPDFLITHAFVVYLTPTTPMLYWTDGGAPVSDTLEPTLLFNPPRKIDVNKAIQYMNGNTNPLEAYTAITRQVLDRIKWPNVFCPTVALVDDTTFNNNRIKGNLFQFKTMLTYDNYERSAWSPISIVAAPLNDEVLGNQFYQPVTFNNAIDVTFQTGDETVIDVSLAVRKSNNGQGLNTEGDFFVVKTFKKYDENGNVLIPSNSSFTYRFYNNETLDPIEINESNKLFDRVPRVSEATEYIDGNRIVDANILEDFDLVEPNVTLLPQRIELPPILTQITPAPTFFVTPVTAFISYATVTVPIGVYQAGDVIQSQDNPTAYYVVTAADLTDPVLFMSNIVTGLQGYYNPADVLFLSGGSVTIPNTTPPVTVSLLTNQFIIVKYSLTTPVTVPVVPFDVFRSAEKVSSFKSGAEHPFGIVYYDAPNRSCSVITGEEFKAYIPFLTELNIPNTLFQKQYQINWGIFHRPPIWATHYQWVYKRNTLASNILQFSIRSATNVGTQTEFQLDPIGDYSTAYPDSLVTYSYTQGDRLRLVCSMAGIPNPFYIETTVTGYDEGTFKLTTNQIDLTLNQVFVGQLIEIYTPKPLQEDSEAFFYEFGENYEIGDAGLPTRYHKGQLQDQDPNNPSIPAVGIFTRGDIWMYPRRMSTANASTNDDYWVESYSLSDFYNSAVWDKGRPNVFVENFREVKRPTTIYYSQPFIEETNINGLSSVFDTNFKSYEQKYGAIKRIYNENRRLTCFQKLKTGVIPINERLIGEANSPLVGQTDAVLNPIVYYNGEYGIGDHPEAFAVYGYAKYFPDTLRGVMCRLSNDGITEISKIYKVHNFTTFKFGEIQAFPTKVDMWGVFDRRHQEYIYAPKDTQFKQDFFEGYTFAFNEAYNMWPSFYGFKPECVGSLGLDIVSFKNGQCYMHLQSSPVSNFYGVQQPSSIIVASNKAPSESKVYLATSLECNKALSAPSIQTSEGNVSNLILSDFEDTEGKWYAGFWFDQNTPNVANPLIEGDSLRGYYMLMELLDDTNTNFSLFSVNFTYAYSRPNGR